MNIYEACREFERTGTPFHRASENGLSHVWLYPTNAFECCIVYDSERREYGKRWNPTLDDLMATDYEPVVDFPREGASE